MFTYLKLNYTRRKLLKVLRSMRSDNGFYRAAMTEQYKFTWLRDNFYNSQPELSRNPEFYKETYQTWLDYLINIEIKYSKISKLILNKEIKEEYCFIHPRIHLNLDEIRDGKGWSYVQIDTVGYLLYGIAKGQLNGIDIIRNQNDVLIINKMVEMLDAINYHAVEEAGAWEECREASRFSTLSAVVAGLKELEKIGINVPGHLITNGLNKMNEVFPNETFSRPIDFAQLFAIFPFDIISTYKAKIIIKNVEENLTRKFGTIRYKGDKYNASEKLTPPEAEWVLGDLFLGCAYLTLKDRKKAKFYLDKVLKNTRNFQIPEAISSDGKVHYNSPLAWSHAMAITLIDRLISERKSIFDRRR